MAEKQINIVIGADIEKLRKGFDDAVKVVGASGKKISSEMDAVTKSIEKDFERIANSPSTKRTVTQLQNLALKVQALGPEFQDMSNKIIQAAGKIKDKVADAGAQITYFASDTRRIDAVISGAQGVAGAFGIATGAAALFGNKNEDLQKTIAKVQGALALMQGIQAVQNVLQKESAFMTGLNAAAQQILAIKTYAAASAMNAFKVAAAATGIGAIVALVVSLASAFFDTAENTDKAKKSQKDYNQELADFRKEREQLTLGEEKYTRKQLAEVNKRLKSGKDEVIKIQADQAETLKAEKAFGFELSGELKKQREDRLAALTLLNEQLAVDQLKLQAKISQIDEQGANKQKTIADNAAKAKLKTKQENLQGEFDLRVSDLKLAESNALQLAKTESEKATIATTFANKILDAKANYLIAQEKLRTAEEKNENLLAQNLAIIDNEILVNNNNLSDKLKALGEKDKDNNKKLIEDAEKLKQDNANFVDKANKNELDAIANFYQEKENQATRDFQNGLLTEKQYSLAILQIQLQRAKNTLQALRDNGQTNTAEVEKQILDLQAKVNEGLKGVDEITKKFNDSINSAFQAMSQGGFEGIGKALGDSISSGASFMDSAFKVVLSSIAGFIEAYGKAMIAYGVAKLALETAFASFNPVLAIAAGVTLVAAATLVRNTEMGGVKAFADGGIVSGPTLGLMGEYPGASSNPEVIAPLSKLQGMLDTSGGSFPAFLETRFDGRDLYLAVKKYERDSKRG
jgi:hypothetical protein